MDHITNRAITSAGLSNQTIIADIVVNNAWTWPHTWYSRFPILQEVSVPVLLHDQEDTLVWKTHDGMLNSFATDEVWQAIREHGNVVEWYHLVWSKYGIPRHSIHLWLVMRRRLKTQDRLKQWDVGGNVDLNLLQCPLCKGQPDSHGHLFFECSFSRKVWAMVLNEDDLPNLSPIWNDILDWLIPISKSNKVTSIVGRLVLAATSYFIWRERNNKIHSKPPKKYEDVVKIILDTVRLKLASIRFKRNVRAAKLMQIWKISSGSEIIS